MEKMFTLYMSKNNRNTFSNLPLGISPLLLWKYKQNIFNQWKETVPKKNKEECANLSKYLQPTPVKYSETSLNEALEQLEVLLGEMIETNTQSVKSDPPPRRAVERRSRFHGIKKSLDDIDTNKSSTEISDDDYLKTIVTKLNKRFYNSGLDRQEFHGRPERDIASVFRPNPDAAVEEDMSIKRRYPSFVLNPESKSFVPQSTIVTLPKKKVEVKFDELNDLTDLIALLDKYPLEPNVEYSVDLSSFHQVKPELQNLNDLIGLRSLKDHILNQIIYFAQGLHIDATGEGDFLHTVIHGPPGTGKTEVARIIGKIISKLGILKKGSFRKVSRADLVGGYLGQTAIKTKEIITSNLGGVLFIDEAYSLGNPEKKDSFAKECIDTLCEALSEYKSEIMVIIAGYEDELRDCFFNYNKGLESRFVWRFKTDDYTGKEMHDIFNKKVKDIGWSVSEDAECSGSWFEENKDSFAYFGRDMETLLAKTKIAHSKRVFSDPSAKKKVLTHADLKKGYASFMENEEINRRKKADLMSKDVQLSMYS